MSMGRVVILVLVGWAVVLGCAGCEEKGDSEEGGFAVDKAYDRGPLSVHVRLGKSEMTIAETVVLSR